MFWQQRLGSLFSSLGPFDYCWLQNVKIAEELCDDKRRAVSPHGQTTAPRVPPAFVEGHTRLQRLHDASCTQLREVCQRELLCSDVTV